MNSGLRASPVDSLPRVLIVSTNADLAGAPSHVRDLVLALRDRFRFVVVFGEEGPIRAHLVEQGIETHVIPELRSAISPRQDYRVVRSLRERIRRVEPALVHAHSSKAGMVARLAGRLEGVPVAYTVHGWGFGPGRPAVQGALVALTERLLAPLTRAYVAVSEADARAGAARLNGVADRIQVVRNGVPDNAARARPAGTADFIMVARTDHAKNHEMALRAFAGLAGDAAFSCVGAGTDLPSFESKLQQWAGPSAARVRRLGTRADIGDLLAAHGVFVLFSRFEGLPLSIIEAMRAGLPVLATRVGGVPELVEDGVTGLLVEPDDIEGARAAMRRLASDPGLRRRLGEAGRRRYDELFSLDTMSASIARIYADVIGG